MFAIGWKDGGCRVLANRPSQIWADLVGAHGFLLDSHEENKTFPDGWVTWLLFGRRRLWKINAVIHTINCWQRDALTHNRDALFSCTLCPSLLLTRTKAAAGNNEETLPSLHRLKRPSSLSTWNRGQILHCSFGSYEATLSWRVQREMKREQMRKQQLQSNINIWV